MKRLRIDVPATSANLGSGFDSLGLALDIADSFLVEPAAAGEGVLMDETTCADAGVQAHDHYTCRAYRAYGEDTGKVLPDARFTLQSHIPRGRGFGSSAAAIVAGLVAAAHLSEDKDWTARVLRLAAELEGHPDNSTAAILGGITVAFCESGNVRALNVVNHVSLGVALFVPDLPLPTVTARAVLPAEVPVRDAVFNVSRAAYLATALAWARWENLASAMQDRLHQPYRAELIPALDHVIAGALESGAYGAALSGGGPSVVALGAQEQAPTIANAMEEAAQRRGWPGHSVVTTVRANGVRVTEVEA